MDYQALYRERLGTLDGALALVRSGDVIASAAYGSEACQFLRRLHEAAERVDHLTVWGAGVMGPYRYLTDPELAGRVDFCTTFYGAYDRMYHEQGRTEYVPANLHSSGPTSTAYMPTTLFVAGVSPMDEDGNFHISLDAENTWEQMETADRIVFEVNRHVPVCYGETSVNIKDVTYFYEADTPMPYPAVLEITETERTIADYVVSLVEDGSTIQLGIGGMPNAVGEGLMCKHDLGIHTEMLTSSMAKLWKAGVVTNKKKTLHRGKTIAAFAFGDQDLYDFIDHNPDLEMRKPAYTNDPFVIAQNEKMVSINTALQIDLTGQVCSESIGFRQYTGTGGASDFAYGAYHSKGGKGILAIASTAKKGTVSKIAPILDPGAIVSISRNIVDYVVTEYGIARLRDRSVRQRVNNLIAVAHPDFRAELRREADRMMLW